MFEENVMNTLTPPPDGPSTSLKGLKDFLESKGKTPFTLNAALIREAGLLAPQGLDPNFDTALCSYLLLDKDLSVILKSIDLASDAEIHLTVQAKSSILGLEGKDLQNFKVIFKLVHSALELILSISLSSTWSFKKSFEFMGGYPFDFLSLKENTFVFSTIEDPSYTWESKKNKQKVNLRKGLNFVSWLSLKDSLSPDNTSIFGPIAEVLTAGLSSDQILFSGLVDTHAMKESHQLFLAGDQSVPDSDPSLDLLPIPNLDLIGTIDSDASLTDTLTGLSVKDPRITLRTTKDNDGFQIVTLNFVLTIQIEKLPPYEFTTQLGKGFRDLNFSFKNSGSDAIDPLVIASLLGGDKVQEALPSVLKDIFKAFSLKGFFVSLTTEKKLSVNRLGVALGPTKPFSLGDLRVEDLTFHYIKSIGSKLPPYFSFTGTFEFLPKVFEGTFFLEMSKRDEGVLIETRYDGQVELQKLLKEIDKSLEIPKDLNFIFSDFSLSFSSTSKGYDYGISGSISDKFKIFDCEVDAHFTATITEMGGEKTYRLDGGCTLGDEYFHLHVDLGDANKVVEARWSPVPGRVVSLNDILWALKIPESPEVMNLSLMFVSFRYDISAQTLKLEIKADSLDLMVNVGKGKNEQKEITVGLFSTPQVNLMPLIPLVKNVKEPFIVEDLSAIYGSQETNSYLNPITQSEEEASRGLSLQTTVLLGESSFSFPESKKTVRPSPVSDKNHVQSLVRSVEPGSVRSAEVTSSSVSGPGLSIPVQKSIGPLYFDTLGIGFQDKDIMLSLDASVAISGLSFDFMGFSMSFPLKDPKHLKFNLNGLGLTYKSGPLTINGSLLHSPKTKTEPSSYTGDIVVQAETFSLVALGSFVPEPDPSLFIFALLDEDLGGSPYFYLTGLAFGFGYNRSLKIPSIEDVTNFPLVSALNDPSSLIGNHAPNSKDAYNSALTVLNKVVPVDHGSYWLAAGVRFTSLDLIHSTALLAVEFGYELEITLLGESWISLPPPSDPDVPAPEELYGYIEVGIEVRVLPSEGVVSATALLTNNSFIIDPDCHLTGGMAFYVWFGNNPNAGQFVLTVGGYHPHFSVPSYFPKVPRLGFNWPLPGNITISGESYFALTPSAIMTGGRLSILYHDGNLKAWFIARMDALLTWAPFHYELTISVRVGASYKLHMLFVTHTFSIELGAKLSLWGPKTGGTVHVNWFILSFTVGFGAGRNQKPSLLDWKNSSGTGFSQSLLPSKKKKAKKTPVVTLLSANFESEEDEKPEVLSIKITQGLIKTYLNNSNETIFVVRANHTSFNVETPIPLTQIKLDSHTSNPKKESVQSYKTVGIRPMGTTLDSSLLAVDLNCLKTNTAVNLSHEFDYALLKQSVPSAKWGSPIEDNTSPAYNETLPDRLLGLEALTPKSPDLTPSGENLIKIEVDAALTRDVVDAQNPYHLPLDTKLLPSESVPKVSDNVLKSIHDTLMSSKVQKARADIFEALKTFEIEAGINGPLDIVSSDPYSFFNGNPLQQGNQL